MASRSKAPTNMAHWGLAIETAKWLLQNRTSLSRNGWVVSAPWRKRAAISCKVGLARPHQELFDRLLILGLPRRLALHEFVDEILAVLQGANTGRLVLALHLRGQPAFGVMTGFGNLARAEPKAARDWYPPQPGRRFRTGQTLPARV